MTAKNTDPLGDTVDPISHEGSPQDWALSCGVCHVGGGQMEFDRDRNDYSTASATGDRFIFEYPSLTNPDPIAVTPGFMSTSNKAEVDCLLCHLDASVAGGGDGNGRALLQTWGCDGTNQLGPGNDPSCTGSSMYPGMLAAGPFTPGTAVDTYNRNFAIKARRFDLAASMDIGAIGKSATGTSIDLPEQLDHIDWGASVPTISADVIAGTPPSANCAPCHARNDDTIGLPGMTTMKAGFGNYLLKFNPGEILDTDYGPGAANQTFWLEFGCKTGMGKRTHKVGRPGDSIGPNARYGMSMFLSSTLDMDPATTPNAGDPIPGKMPDIDVHTEAGMTCGTCHYTLGSIDAGTTVCSGDDTVTGCTKDDYSTTAINEDSCAAAGIGTCQDARVFPASTKKAWQADSWPDAVDYPGRTVAGIDHMFAQGDSFHDTNLSNWADGTVSCESCHTTRTNPRLSDNGGSLVSPTPLHAAFPSLHFDKIACTTCHVPEVYAAPGRLKYRDWTAGFWKTSNFRNMLDWNFDLITGSHVPMPVAHQWLTKFGETKIYPVLPSVIPMWFENIAALPEGGELGSTGVDKSGNTAADEGIDPWGSVMALNRTNPFMMESPVKARDNAIAALRVQANHPEFDIRLNGGNAVPLFDGFSLADSWEIDTKAEIDEMLDAFNGEGSYAADGKVVEAESMLLEMANFDVTHGIVPAEWALGGAKRGGCVSCHSSADPKIDMDPTSPTYGQPTNPQYSPYSVGFFEGMIQPLNNAGMGIGGFDPIKNWFALFADYDCTAMCDPNPMDGLDDSLFFDQAGNPNMTADCSAGMGAALGFTTLGDCIGMMTSTFDKVMGFPAGTAMQMGMYDGISGLQGFTVREPVAGAKGTLGCNPFGGPESFSPMGAQANVNNCMPDAAMFNGTCVGADMTTGTPGACDGGFRAGGPCMVPTDCTGRITDAAELAQNPYGMIYQRSEVRSHFKLDLQQSYKANAHGEPEQRVKWPLYGSTNPGNQDGHIAMLQAMGGGQALNGNKSFLIDWATQCWDYSAGNPMQPGVKACGDGDSIATVIPMNVYLGYNANMLAALKTPQSSPYFQGLDASFLAKTSDTVSLQVDFDASGSLCPDSDCSYAWDFGDGTVVSGMDQQIVSHTYGSDADVQVTLTVTDVDANGDPSPGYFDTQTRTVTPRVIAPALEPGVTADTSLDPAVSLTITAGEGVTLTKVYVFWGDGYRTILNPYDPAAAISHTYAKNATYACTVYVYDSYGQRTSYRLTIPISGNN